MRLMLAIAGSTLLGAATIACRAPSGFGCSGDEQCVSLQGSSGQCFSVGACGYLDPACQSGYRYSEYAPAPWAGKCVAGEDMPGSSGDASSSSGDDTSTTSEPASSSSGTPDPVCGNGQLDGDEFCDDGNVVEADGCNPDCRISGMELFSFISQTEGNDEATAVQLTEDGGIVVGGHYGESSNLDGFVARIDEAGAEAWIQILEGTADRDDVVWDLALTPDGNVRAVGQIINAVAKKGVTPREDVWLAEFDAQTGEPIWMFTHGDPPPSTERAYAMTLLPIGDTVVASRSGAPTNSTFAVSRYSVIEVNDEFEFSEVWNEAFDGGAGGGDRAEAIAFDPVGQRVVVAGAMEYEVDNLDRHLRALDISGNALEPPCEDLGGDDPLSEEDRIFDVAVGPIGEVVAVGRASRDADEGNDAWVGYYPPGSCALAWVETEPGSGQERDAFTAVAIDDLGHIVAGGYLYEENTEDAWLAKYNASGERLWAIEPIDGPGNGADRVTELTIGPDREITVVGRLSRPGDTDVWVARFTP